MKAVLALAAALTLCAAPAVAFEEQNVDRRGVTYASTPAASPTACRRACQADAECLAWTFVRPPVQGPTGVCELKAAIAPGFASPCCVSGIAPHLEAKRRTTAADETVVRRVASRSMVEPDRALAGGEPVTTIRPKPRPTPPAKTAAAAPSPEPAADPAPEAKPEPAPQTVAEDAPDEARLRRPNL